MDLELCLSYWPFLDQLDPKVIGKIRSLIVIPINYDANNIGMIWITEDDRVYGYSQADTTRLFPNEKEPIEIVELSGKQVIEIQYGHGHLMALTKSGQVYAWGKNNFGQIGNGTKETCPKPILLNLGDDPIVMIRCGWGRNLAVTSTGLVYAWGANDIGQSGVGNPTGQLLPTKMDRLLNRVGQSWTELKVVDVECGYSHSMALTADGRLYSWGWNESGQLGLGDQLKRTMPTRVIIDGDDTIKVKRISCRSNHSLILTESGQVYASGLNDRGQVGTGRMANRLSFGQISCQDRFIDIGTLQHQSVAKSECGLCYVWGQLKNEEPVQTSPRMTNLTDIQKVFAMYLQERSTSRLMPILQPNHRPSSGLRSPLLAKLVASFNQPELSDLQFVVDGQIIYVHRLLLQYTSDYYNRMLSDVWHNSNRIELSKREDNSDNSGGYCYSVHLAHLRYLYTGQFVVTNLEETIELLDLSTSYLELDLQAECVHYLSDRLSESNCCRLYQLADLYKLTKFKQTIATYIYGHLAGVVRSEEFQLFDANLFKNIMLQFPENLKQIDDRL